VIYYNFLSAVVSLTNLLNAVFCKAKHSYPSTEDAEVGGEAFDSALKSEDTTKHGFGFASMTIDNKQRQSE
jgi:hypothetical protein